MAVHTAVKTPVYDVPKWFRENGREEIRSIRVFRRTVRQIWRIRRGVRWSGDER